MYFLQVIINESKGDEEQGELKGEGEGEINRNKEVDLEKARAEWRVADGRMVVFI